MTPRSGSSAAVHATDVATGDYSDDWCAACRCGWSEWRPDRAGALAAAADHLADRPDARDREVAP